MWASPMRASGSIRSSPIMASRIRTKRTTAIISTASQSASGPTSCPSSPRRWRLNKSAGCLILKVFQAQNDEALVVLLDVVHRDPEPLPAVVSGAEACQPERLSFRSPLHRGDVAHRLAQVLAVDEGREFGIDQLGRRVAEQLTGGGGHMRDGTIAVEQDEGE